MRQEEFQLWRATSRAIEQAERQHLSGQWQRPFDIYLTKAPFPMPPPLSTNLATSPVYVQVEHVRRIDTQILRHYPDSYAEFPFYEVRARILNTWGGYTNQGSSLPVHIPFRLQAGQRIRLLWGARRPIEGEVWTSEEEYQRERAAQRQTQIWEVGKRYLLFGFRGFALDAPEEESVAFGA